MADTATPTDTSETEAEPTTTTEGSQQARQEAPPEMVAALKKANKEAETLRLKLKGIEDASKSESERNAADAAEARKDAASARTEVLRLRTAISKKLPAELADRLRGDTQEEMEADADALLKAFAPKNGTGGSFDTGARQTAPAAPDMNSQLRRMAGRA